MYVYIYILSECNPFYISPSVHKNKNNNNNNVIIGEIQKHSNGFCIILEMCQISIIFGGFIDPLPSNNKPKACIHIIFELQL